VVVAAGSSQMLLPSQGMDSRIDSSGSSGSLRMCGAQNPWLPDKAFLRTSLLNGFLGRREQDQGIVCAQVHRAIVALYSNDHEVHLAVKLQGLHDQSLAMVKRSIFKDSSYSPGTLECVYLLVFPTSLPPFIALVSTTPCRAGSRPSGTTTPGHGHLDQAPEGNRLAQPDPAQLLVPHGEAETSDWAEAKTSGAVGFGTSLIQIVDSRAR